jgi:transcriptional regulator GlxA family with amidase domain
MHLINANRFDAARDVPWHRHVGAELVLVTGGACRISAGGVEMEAEAGDLFVLPANVEQYQWSHGRVCTTYAVFRAAGFDDLPRVVETTPATQRWIEDLADLHAAGDGAVAGHVLAAVLESIHRQDRRNASAKRRHPAVASAMAFIDANLDRPLSVDDIADHAAVSASHLSALFRRETAAGVLGYALDRRLDRARRLLIDPLLSVAQVAAMCGFEDANYFVRYFRKRVGKPPGEWRKQSIRSS